LDDLASFLAEEWHTLPWFQLRDKLPSDHISPEEQRRWRTISERAVWVAQRSALATDDSRALTLGLLHVVPYWVGEASSAAAVPWPTWLEPIAGLRAPAPDDTPVWKVVRQAVADWSDKSIRREWVCESQGSVRDAWQAPGAIRFSVMAVDTRLARARALEGDFQERLETEKLLSLKELAYGASHEINNPLANISTRAQTLLRDEEDPERRKKLATINSQAFRAHEMISDMMLFAKPPTLKIEEVDLAQTVTEVCCELGEDAERQHTRLSYHGVEQPLLAEVDGTHLGVGLRAMCINSLEAIGAGGEIDVTVATDDHFATIEVRDSGPGISAEVRSHLFDPFYSGREAGRGLGFGLSKCWRIIQQHGGDIDVESGQDGTTFVIRIPRSQAWRQRCAS